MKPFRVLIIAASMAGLAAGTAAAACPDESAAATPKIAKDASKAPMETPKNAPGVTDTEKGTTTNMAETGGGQVSKNGQTMPLANKQGGGDTDTAMSQEDAQAQQKGQETAAAKAQDDTACKE